VTNTYSLLEFGATKLHIFSLNGSQYKRVVFTLLAFFSLRKNKIKKSLERHAHMIPSQSSSKSCLEGDWD
jgi:hypothetical protein